MKKMIRFMVPSPVLILSIAGVLLGPIRGNPIEFPDADKQTAQFPQGEIIEQVICPANPDQSYALYLPSTYDPQVSWPIIYAFDPAARGRVPVKRFSIAAEKYGYILVGSNNSRNGPWAANFTAARAMWADTRERLHIDTTRVYATGFSGGARVACEVAYKPQYHIAGVIAHGAGFRQGHGPTHETPFIFYGLVGNEDFNFLELRDLARILDDFNIPNRLTVFDGPHDWADDTICMEAVEWLELQAMQTGTREKNEDFLDLLFEKTLNQAEEHEKSGRSQLAYRGYLEVSEDFRGLRDIGQAETKATQLAASKEVSRYQRRERKRREKEERELQSVGQNFAAIIDPAQRRDAINTIIRTASRFQESGKKKYDPAEAQMRARIRNYIVSLAWNDGLAYLERKYYPEAVAVLEMWCIIQPDQPAPFYHLAGAYAVTREKEKALTALETAIDNGFDDLRHIERNPYLFSLQREEAYQQMIMKLEAAQPPGK
ncbi:MAG: hypothetical protein JSW54_09770 [Fidelibacterota bacterium]|nr:MAG: hypothetical protein JSW54_09770 [Candidatus Neomarinimicrobiota bacterium]